MPKDYPRSERLASQIHRELSSLISHSLKDPRLASPSILDVQLTRDLSQARVYFSVLNAEDSLSTADALNHAAGFLQRELGKVIKSRTTPKLSFIFDDTDIRGRNMDELIDAAVFKDKQKSNHQ
ncbi:MAG: 30S ribosome-binding factor RbfA [Gammaproteobacteria bacterium]|nr:30S ribosome-binding factor RbfA [Gammaproteobacteria bacterium]